MTSPRARFPLQANALPNITEADPASTASPARGKAMRQNLLGKLRPPTLVHNWDFWHDRQDRQPRRNSPSKSPQPAEPIAADEYETRLIKLHGVGDVKEFWEMFNNFDVSKLPLRDSVHLFHRGVKPVWEDPRNERGGAWTFRVPKDRAVEFWKHIALMAIGEKLQAAVASKRITFVDDICGVSLSVRYTSFLVTIWNRDANHVEGKQRIVETVLAELPAELQPKDGSYYYKAHSEHAGFRAGQEGGATTNETT